MMPVKRPPLQTKKLLSHHRQRTNVRKLLWRLQKIIFARKSLSDSVISTGILVSNRESFSKADRIASDDKITETSDSRTEFTGSMNATDEISNKISASGKNLVSGIQAQAKLASEMIVKSEHSMIKSEDSSVLYLSAAFCDMNINDSLNSCGEKISVVDSSKDPLDRSLREYLSELKESGSPALQNSGK